MGRKFFGSKFFWVNFFLHESSSWVKLGLHAENQLPGWSGSGVKVCVVVVGGFWPIIGSNQLYWLRLSWVLTILQLCLNSLHLPHSNFSERPHTAFFINFTSQLKNYWHIKSLFGTNLQIILTFITACEWSGTIIKYFSSISGE